MIYQTHWKRVLKRLLEVACIVVTMIVFRPSTWYWFIVCFLPWIAVFKIVRGEKHKVKDYLVTMAFLVGFFYLFRWSAGWGVAGTILLVVGIAAWRLVSDVKSGDSMYLGACRDIETKLWGEPLDGHEKRTEGNEYEHERDGVEETIPERTERYY